MRFAHQYDAEYIMVGAHNREPPRDVLSDNQATTSLFKEKSLLTNVRTVEVEASFDGVGGTLRTDVVGDIRDFGTVCYSPRAPANILSYSEVKKTRFQYQSFVVTTPVYRYVLRRRRAASTYGKLPQHPNSSTLPQ